MKSQSFRYRGGVVRIAGIDMTKVPPNLRPVNTVFQSYALFPHLNVIENVCFGLRMARVPKDEQRTRAKEALDLVGLGAFAERPVAQLSGGQAQRVAIARALLHRCVCGRQPQRHRDDRGDARAGANTSKHECCPSSFVSC